MQNAGVFLDINALRSVENIRRAVAKYREQQEFLLMKIAPPKDYSTALVQKEFNFKIFDHLCIVASVRKNRYKLGSWIPAMVGSFVAKTVDLGNFESTGSLWRFIRLDDQAGGGIRAVLECSVSCISFRH